MQGVGKSVCTNLVSDVATISVKSAIFVRKAIANLRSLF